MATRDMRMQERRWHPGWLAKDASIVTKSLGITCPRRDPGHNPFCDVPMQNRMLQEDSLAATATLTALPTQWQFSSLV